MLRLPIQHVLPGMVLAQPVVHPQRVRYTLLNGGIKLTGRAIAHITKLKVPALWIEHPSFRLIDRFIQPGIHQIYDELKVKVEDLLDSLMHRDEKGWAQRPMAEDLIRRLLLEMTTQRDILIFKDDPPITDQSWLATHAASTCYLTALLALDLHAYIQRERRKASATPQQEMLHLCLGALVHDIGLRKLSPKDYDGWVAHGDEKNKRWQHHVRLGYELAHEHLAPSSATVVLHHHQYYDQSGFPCRLNWEGKTESFGGRALHIFSRIVTAADQFDELKHQPDGTIWPNVRALRHLLMRENWSRLDPRVARALVQVIPAYTPGSMVTLSTGERGFVIDWKPASPCQPTVALVRKFSDLIFDPEKVGVHEHCAVDAGAADVVDAGLVDAGAAGVVANAGFPGPECPWVDQTKSAESSVWPFQAVNLARTAGVHIVDSDGIDVSQDNFALPYDIRPQHKTGGEFSANEAA